MSNHPKVYPFPSAKWGSLMIKRNSKKKKKGGLPSCTKSESLSMAKSGHWTERSLWQLTFKADFILVPQSLEQIGFCEVFFSRQPIKLFASTSTSGTINGRFLFLTWMLLTKTTLPYWLHNHSSINFWEVKSVTTPQRGRYVTQILFFIVVLFCFLISNFNFVFTY